ncbi:hypothetical protein SO802_016542 [Lithocarpus litseifolius]|uniref:Uncharacterized protein n=1 Tax=Lithocarpus litseifolius TaxID=425828 RepID=A0AAW2D0H5_9ROSI
MSTNLNLDMSQIIAQHKKTLSDTFNIFFPFSGSIKTNLFIHDFETGVPFSEARVNCSMSEFLKHQETNLLALFVPYRTFCKETDTTIAQVAIKLNIFVCGGIAIGLSCSHKIEDATTSSSFLHSWDATFTGSPEKPSHGLIPILRKICKGNEGFLAFSDYFDQLEEMFSAEIKPDVWAFTCLLRFFNDLDFG